MNEENIVSYLKTLYTKLSQLVYWINEYYLNIILGCFVLIFILPIIFIIYTLLFDIFIGKYKFKNIKYRRHVANTGGKLDYYLHYWIWQRNKKKVIISFFKNNGYVVVFDNERTYKEGFFIKSKNILLRQVIANKK